MSKWQVTLDAITDSNSEDVEVEAEDEKEAMEKAERLANTWPDLVPTYWEANVCEPVEEDDSTV